MDVLDFRIHFRRYCGLQKEYTKANGLAVAGLVISCIIIALLSILLLVLLPEFL